MPNPPQQWKNLVLSLMETANLVDVADMRWHGPEDVMGAFDRCLYGFEDDFILSQRKLSRFVDFPYFESDKGRYVAVLKNSLAEWQKKGPSLPALICAYLDVRGLKPNDIKNFALVKAALLGATLAEVDTGHGDDGYHNVVHFREVTILNMVALSGEEYLTRLYFPIDLVAKQLTIAAAHDLFHTGKDNTQSGQYIPYFLEQRSFEAFEPYLKACDVPPDHIEDIQVGILITDITKGPEQKYTAHQFVRQAFAWQFMEGDKPNLPDEFQLLASDETGITDTTTRGQDLTRLCVRMQESDTLSSAMDQHNFYLRYSQIRSENPDKYPENPDQQSFIRFLSYVFSDGRKQSGGPMMLSNFYRAWFQDRISKVYNEAILRSAPKSVASNQ